MPTANPLAFPGRDLYEQGMTLRDYFAAKAMQSLISEMDVSKLDGDNVIPSLTALSYVMADAMLTQREK